MPQRILVYTKDKSIAALLNDGSAKRDFVVSVAYARKKVLSLVAAGRVDFLLLDMADSSERAVHFCHEIRALDQNVHLLLATPDKRSRRTQKLVDACFVKPITWRKVLYHIRRLLRVDASKILNVGDIVLDPRNRTVQRAGLETHLTPKETRLLQLLMEHAGHIVSRKEIMQQVWNTAYMGDTRTIDVHIRWLRLKIEPVPSRPRYICTVRGHGYRFEKIPAQLMTEADAGKSS